ncbi:MAG: SpoIIE family protein phosphatase [Desulfobacterales bacterium]|nr:MAG: SpoIIE family protein phosphatase [Desulfobacterales bacterium]
MFAIPSRFVLSNRGRLSRRIVFWVFASVIVIETIILIPSFKNREKELLAQLKEVSTAKISLIMQLAPSKISDKELFDQIKGLHQSSQVVGGTLYRSDGTVVGVFGESPEFRLPKIEGNELIYLESKKGDRYDLVCSLAQLKRDYILILRHDASPIRRALYAFTLRIAGLVDIISIFVTTGAWFALNPIVVKPILRLREDLIKAGNAISQDQQTPAFYSASVQRQDELGEVIEAFRHMYKQITDAINERRRAEVALQKSFEQVEAYSKALNSELEIGRQMQTNFLPAQLVTKSGWEFSAFFKPARQVAGDFYDVFDLPGDAVGVVIADVCDKGVGAALFMALFRSLIRIFSGQTTLEGLACLYNGESISEEESMAGIGLTHPDHLVALKAIQFTNMYIAQNHGELAMFATLFFGVLDPKTGTLTYINGGHEPLLIIDKFGGVRKQLNPTGPAVGIQLDAAYQIKETRLEPGEILLGYTDGIIEASSDDGNFFTSEQLLSLLEDEVPSAAVLLNHISDQVKSHTGDAEQFDDITLLAIRRLRQSEI